jgi:membrane peptidoglycan carboxypeptidase
MTTGTAGDSGGTNNTIPLHVPAAPDQGYEPIYRRRAAYGPPGARPRWRRRRWPRRLTRLLAVFLVLVFMGAIAFGGLLIMTPSAGNAEQLARAQASEHHSVYPGPAVPSKFSRSLVATEDHRFYSEPGIDVFAIARVGASYLTGDGGKYQGGATLYQQLAKLLYTGGQSTTSNEPEQVALAVKLDLKYSKAQILRMYAGIVYFGTGYYGLSAASCGYFGVHPSRLSWAQAAMMAGLVQGPTLDNPVRHPAAARARETHVLGRLVATGVLTSAQAARALAVPVSDLLAHRGGCVG